ncbi:MAG: DUF2007 domain-containing protein [Anaerolineae bacterium]|nr:DUF2007 domain-containing protein [Anaerolineae bacterium]
MLSRLFRPRQRISTAEIEHETGAGGDDPAPWVVVLTTYSIVQAQLALARLRDEGILTRLRQEAASRAIPVDFGIIGRIDILVPDGSEEKAAQVIAETINVDLPDEQDDWET